MTLAVDPAHLAIVHDILTTHLPSGTKIWAFGSRTTATVKPYSDLDLAIDAPRPLTLEETASLRDAFTESDLPWKVDIIDRQTVGAAFWNAIAPGAILL